ncbi:hypothetical protein [Desulfobacter curvatus]|uniref:hypothetical protein n=1 Tax=Desulfobacter curvatus TaxID=2290 RepID=UPI00036132A0|nr:hypothetical protein [Desulfobacter curvatus]
MSKNLIILIISIVIAISISIGVYISVAVDSEPDYQAIKKQEDKVKIKSPKVIVTP